MFVRQSEHDKVVAQNTELIQQNTDLQQQVEGITTENASRQSEVDTITADRDRLAAENVQLISQVEESAGRITELEAEVTRLTTENAELATLPGAESARVVSETEASHAGNMSDLDRLNQFCKENAGDINACIAAVEKAKIN